MTHIRTHHTILFTSPKTAESFKNRLIKEGKEKNINQEIEVKQSTQTKPRGRGEAIVYRVTFKLDKTRPRKSKKDDYDNWWQESNLNGDFAYNGVTDDF